MLHLFAGLDLHTGLLLLLALAFVLFYEAINGFHDTANAVATVIYTRAMRSQLAVVMAAVFNFLGVLLGGLSVAYAIVHMLPTDLLLNMGSSHGLAMVFSMLLAAIIWNLGTWYFGLPASSSHTLIGAIIGIGLTNALMTGTSVVDALNIPKVLSIFGSLIVSPIVGLVFAGGLIFLLRRYWSGTKKRARIHLTPAEREKKDGKKKPPFWTRIALILSAIGVAFSHGANDGQKGIGLVMLVLIGVAPAGFVVNMNATGYEITRTRDAINNAKAGVSASIINVGNGEYRLSVTSNDTGLDNAMTLSVSGDDALQSFMGYDASASSNGMEVSVAAQNAQLTVNNVAIENSSNTISNALENITLNLNDVTTGNQTLTITQDTSKAQTAIKDWVNAYNSLIDTFSSLTKYTAVDAGADSQNSSNGALLGDSTLRTIQTQLKSMLSNTVSSSNYKTLAQIGITTDPSDGKLELDADKLTAALKKDAS
ncbi:MAG: flagellar filament capping protein FliD, partial [Escherichia coli]|nr:flagellar filament capping protein FliD [Escherichia coli]